MFGSDNQAPAHPLIIEAVVKANSGRSGSYGDDTWTKRALSAMREAFETDDLDMYVVGTGTAANGLGLSILCPPWGAVLALADAHIIADEGAGPEHFTSGARMIGVGGGAARLSAQHLEEASARYVKANVQGPQPRAVSISNLSENGMVYYPAEIKALSAICQREGWGLHMDGARFANAVAGSGCAPAELTWRSGVDALSLGLTKNGALCAEALIIFGQKRDGAAAYLRKRAGHLFSKQRYLSAQIATMLEQGLWLELADHANAMAVSLAQVFTEAGAVIVHLVEGNEVFVRLNTTQTDALKQASVGFYLWPPAGEACYRFVTSWETSQDEISTVAGALAKTKS